MRQIYDGRPWLSSSRCSSVIARFLRSGCQHGMRRFAVAEELTGRRVPGSTSSPWAWLQALSVVRVNEGAGVFDGCRVDRLDETMHGWDDVVHTFLEILRDLGLVSCKPSQHRTRVDELGRDPFRLEIHGQALANLVHSGFCGSIGVGAPRGIIRDGTHKRGRDDNLAIGGADLWEECLRDAQWSNGIELKGVTHDLRGDGVQLLRLEHLHNITIRWHRPIAASVVDEAVDGHSSETLLERIHAILGRHIHPFHNSHIS
mmetsp:Transcript_17331/g.50387  ORF Transcript_17331/g.50387 Transcript_17331/m.50387 type:complete len:259 (-) Transcript_17331:207-983(-)